MNTFKPRIARNKIAATFVTLAIIAIAPAHAQFKFKQVQPQKLEESAQTVTPSFEGWWQNADGTYNLLFGYFNRNTREELDIPIGPNNRMQISGSTNPGLPEKEDVDQGQPTHFLPRRHKGVFTVTVPKDFGAKKLVWTLVSHGHTLSVPGHLGAAWIINPMSEVGIGNTPPTISFDEHGPSGQGPKPLIVECDARVGQPLSFTVFAADDDKSIGIRALRTALEVALKASGQNTSMPPPAPGPGGDAVATPDLLKAAAAAGFDADTVNIFKGGPSVSLTWEKYRGTGDVTFDDPHPQVEATPGSGLPIQNTFNGKSVAIATFNQPGEYVLRVVANDSSGPDGGDFMCCWTNAEVRVTVK